ncbi:centromere protein L isoform X1 [Girardinichthys multiradiatus]|uniref:centromere protein L isoform X1 n=2 Tax=Girardinichthys multiradiatus TaxID=208333 RepID=UPI001FAD23FD|nr:centromere protein L isoform X1 [Girardinichthys multiradiatus]
MEGSYMSVAKTPHGSVVKRRSKSQIYQQSIRSCFSVASRLGLTPGQTKMRLNTSRKAPKSQNITDKVNPEHLALMIKTEWQLSYVTPLYQFRHTQLKSYARQLSAFIAAEKQQGLAVEVGAQQNTFKVSISVLEGLAETNDDPETVLIQVQSKPLFARQDDPQKTVWSGWLSCINSNPEYLRSLSKDFTCLPLFGCKGAEGFTSLVKDWLQRTFDCCFGLLEISQTSLQWLAALWTNCHMESNVQSLKMHWALPVVPPLHVTYTVSADDALDLWNSVRKNSPEKSKRADEEECVDIEEVTRFMQGLMSHFYRHFRVDLSAGDLTQVSTALGSAKRSGRIKISNSRYLINTLSLLTEIAFLKMPI